MPRIIIALSFISVLMGCTTTSRIDTRIEKHLNPPLPSFLAKWKNATPAQLEKLAVGSNENNIFWWKTYTLSLVKKTSTPAESCTGFKTLSEIQEFPLHDLALLRAYEVCPNNEKLNPLPQAVTPWYRNLYADIKLKESLETPDLKDDLDAYLEKAKLESNKKNKEDYLLKSLLLAQKLELKDETEQVQTQLYRNSPRLNPAPTFKDLSAVAMDYRFHRDFDKALGTYKKIIASKEATTDDKFQAFKNIRMTYKVAQRRQEYINASSDLVNWSKKQFKANKKDKRVIARFHDTQVLFARTLWTEDQSTQAMKVLNETHKLLRGLYPMDEVYFIMGRMEEEKGNFAKALEYLEASYEQPVSMAGLRDKIVWLKSWNYYKLEKWAEARKSLEQMKEVTKEPSDMAKARFWLSRTLNKLNDRPAATSELEMLSKEDPLGYYGMLAYRELDREFPAVKNDTDETMNLSLLGVNELDPQLRQNIEWLIAVNEKPFAEKALNQAADELKKNNVTSESTWLTMSSGFARAGLYLPLFSTIGALQPEVKDQLQKDHPDLLFPQPYRDVVDKASQKSGTPREFIYSIIRQESAFNPEARSPADAFGLMQLLPSVAKQLAVQNKLEYKEANDLFKPEINIPLGAFELKTLMKKYNNQYILAVSGYNANDSAIRGWLKTRFRPDSVEFIEEVPYEETRAYIKLTMRNYVFYQRLLSPGTNIKFPEELLKLNRP
ncbi:lytic transglycosylase domain-containing protein [Bdellovibrio svalbardensis]|uniref:Lytic transglycosylase domain-containing protein n=1 Tax=Bdellovibrio svalbardensis TaxID=2972972 RepID=A0ABT6DNV7_9BACT|nr:lytic transglycosylase domain-containing protein [Bdellovibrio svalbardensis]MDG0817775.1 lytic transglycosylase domain-containing protein [Bdellovibrio svalbardensis]